MLSPPVPDQVVEEIVKRVEKRFSMKPKVAFAGFGNSGKSSLFNAVYGQNVASVSMRTDETTEPQSRERFGIDFTDTPGIGTGKFSLEKVEQMGVFEGQHVVVHVLNGAAAISAEDEKLHEMIVASKTRRVTVVNKVDILDEAEQSECAVSVFEKLGLSRDDFVFVSAKRGVNIGDLVERIAEVLPDAMQDAFIAQQAGDMRIKERRIRGLIYVKAALCSAVGAVPIPVADIFIITPIQIGMVTAIGHFHGVKLSAERAGELMATLTAGVGLREVARQLLKLVPGYGSVASSAIAFAGTVALGEVANTWFKKKMRLDADELKALFKDFATRAKDQYRDNPESAALVKATVVDLQRRFKAGEMTKAEFEMALASLE